MCAATGIQVRPFDPPGDALRRKNTAAAEKFLCLPGGRPRWMGFFASGEGISCERAFTEEGCPDIARGVGGDGPFPGPAGRLPLPNRPPLGLRCSEPPDCRDRPSAAPTIGMTWPPLRRPHPPHLLGRGKDRLRCGHPSRELVGMGPALPGPGGRVERIRDGEAFCSQALRPGRRHPAAENSAGGHRPHDRRRKGPTHPLEALCALGRGRPGTGCCRPTGTGRQPGHKLCPPDQRALRAGFPGRSFQSPAVRLTGGPTPSLWRWTGPFPLLSLGRRNGPQPATRRTRCAAPSAEGERGYTVTSSWTPSANCSSGVPDAQKRGGRPAGRPPLFWLVARAL